MGKEKRRDRERERKGWIEGEWNDGIRERGEGKVSVGRKKERKETKMEGREGR